MNGTGVIPAGYKRIRIFSEIPEEIRLWRAVP